MTIIDEGNREALGVEAWISIPAARVIRVLEELIALHGRPAAIRVDNGPELLAQVFVDWCGDRGIALHYIQPGEPDQNAYIQRFNRSAARPSRSSPEVRERAIRLVREHGPEHPSQWAAITSIASKLGCTAQTLRNWVVQAERDAGRRSGLTTDERQRLKDLERENRELKRTNEILRKASAYFAQAELDRRVK